MDCRVQGISYHWDTVLYSVCCIPRLDYILWGIKYPESRDY